jgi:dephospho-CoA kinase
MLKVGLTGGLACGKSFVGQALADLGCKLIQADVLGHEALSPGGAAYAGVVSEFGPQILDANGFIDRRRLANDVFENPERLAILNGLVHPPVLRREEELVARYTAEDPHAVVVVEAAILIETGSYKRFHRLILVVCNEEQQLERAVKRDGCTREEAAARLSRQMPLAEKRKFAHYVINTSGTKEETLRQTRDVYNELRRLVA